MLLRDSKAIKKLARENMTLAQKIKAWIDDFVKNIRKAFEGVSAKSLEAKQLEIILGDMTELQNMWDEALEDALRTSKGTANGTQTENTVDNGKSEVYSKRSETDGDYDAPYIREIIEVMTDAATEFEDAKERIFDVEKGKSQKQDAARVLENFYGDGFILTYRSGTVGVYSWENGKRKGITRSQVIKNNQRKQNGKGNDTEGRGTESVKFSERVFDDQGFTHRELLRNALSTVAQNDTERDFLARYQREIKDVEKKYEEVAKLRRQIHDISFTKGSDRSKYFYLEIIRN